MRGTRLRVVLVFLMIWSARSGIGDENNTNNAMVGESIQLPHGKTIKGEGGDKGIDLGGIGIPANSFGLSGSNQSPTCWLRDLCSGRCELSSRVFDKKISNSIPCKCDQLCVVFGDCCVDYFQECFNLTQDGESELVTNVMTAIQEYLVFVNVNESVPKRQVPDIAASCTVSLRELSSNFTLESLFLVQSCFQCKRLTIYDDRKFTKKSLHVLTKCPILGEKQSTKVACESPKPPLFNIPVQDIKEPALIYRNMHCAICHGKEVADVSQWIPAISCPEPEFTEIILNSSNEINEYIEGKCMIGYTPTNATWTRAECPYDHTFKELPTLVNSSRINIELKLCQLYFDPVSHPLNRSTIYRNEHCANLDMVRNLDCLDIKELESDSIPGPTLIVKPLSVLFSFKNSAVGIQYGEEIIYLSPAEGEECSVDEVYSFLSRRCEKNLATMSLTETEMFIHIDIRVLSSVCGLVVPDIGSFLGSTLLLGEDKACVTLEATEFKLATRQENATLVINEQPSAIVNLLLTKPDGMNTQKCKSKIHCGWWHIDYKELNNLEHKATTDQDYCETELDILFESDDLAWETFVDFLKNVNEAIDKYSGIFYSPDREFILVYENISVTNENRESNKTCPSENRVDIAYTVNEENPWILTLDQEPSRNISLQNWAFFLDYHFGSNSSNGRHDFKICDQFGSGDQYWFPNCNVVFSVDHTKYWTKDGNLYISVNFNVFKISKYQKVKGTMYYCADSVIKVPDVLHDNSVLTIVSLSLSLTSLLFVIMTYTFFSPLRNLPGKIVIGLTSNLFCAMLLFLFGTGQTKNPVLCTIMAALLHFFWLASFFWTTVLSFNLAQTFGSKTMTVRYEKKSFLYYCTYSFAGPLLIVLATLLEGFFHKPDSWVHGSYGSAAACWISQRWVNIVAFGLPVGLTVLLNTVMFLYTVRSLYKISKITKRVHKKENRGQSTILYFKLSLIMGLSWALFFLSGVLENEILRALSIVLNALQGFFLFLVFVCNKHVYTLYRDVFHSFTLKGQTLPAGTETTLTSKQNRI